MTIFEDEEDDMHSTFERLMGGHIDDKLDAYLYHEVRTSNRHRCDFVVVNLDLDRLWERFLSYQHTEPMPKDHYNAVTCSKKYCPVPKEDLIERCSYPDREEAEEAVDWLIENNYLLEDSEGWLRFHRPPHVINRVDVFELKLHKWEKALRQARGYRKSIGEAGYVVLDADHTQGARNNLEEFKNSNIGLMAMDRESIEVIHNPSPRNRIKHVGKYRTPLSERAFNDFSRDHPKCPNERYDRRSPEDIGTNQNPLQAMKNARIATEVLD